MEVDINTGNMQLVYVVRVYKEFSSYKHNELMMEYLINAIDGKQFTKLTKIYDTLMNICESYAGPNNCYTISPSRTVCEENPDSVCTFSLSGYNCAYNLGIDRLHIMFIGGDSSYTITDGTGGNGGKMSTETTKKTEFVFKLLNVYGPANEEDKVSINSNKLLEFHSGDMIDGYDKVINFLKKKYGDGCIYESTPSIAMIRKIPFAIEVINFNIYDIQDQSNKRLIIYSFKVDQTTIEKYYVKTTVLKVTDDGNLTITHSSIDSSDSFVCDDARYEIMRKLLSKEVLITKNAYVSVCDEDNTITIYTLVPTDDSVCIPDDDIPFTFGDGNEFPTNPFKDGPNDVPNPYEITCGDGNLCYGGGGDGNLDMGSGGNGASPSATD